MFSVQLQRQTPYALFQNPNIMKCESMRILGSETGDKAGTWIKGLGKLSNNFILPDRATFHSIISWCPWQYLGEICVCVYIYHTFQFVYQRCKFHPRPCISGHCFQTAYRIKGNHAKNDSTSTVELFVKKKPLEEKANIREMRRF